MITPLQTHIMIHSGRTHNERTSDERATREGTRVSWRTNERRSERHTRRLESAFTPHHTRCDCVSERKGELTDGGGGAGSDGGRNGHGEQTGLTVLNVPIGRRRRLPPATLHDDRYAHAPLVHPRRTAMAERMRNVTLTQGQMRARAMHQRAERGRCEGEETCRRTGCSGDMRRKSCRT